MTSKKELFLECLRRQWSWYNDGVSFLFMNAVCFAFTASVLYNSTIDMMAIMDTSWISIFAIGTIIYAFFFVSCIVPVHIIKFIFFAFVLFVIYHSSTERNKLYFIKLFNARQSDINYHDVNEIEIFQ